MGAWRVLALDNDWAYGLDDVENLSLVELALDQVVDVGDDYLDQDIACNALAACEVLARLRGEPGYTSLPHVTIVLRLPRPRGVS
jgi:hypothetical protein